MISYFETIRGAEIPRQWREQWLALNERVLAAALRLGDTSETDGRSPDDLVRYVVNYDPAPRLDFTPALIIEARFDGITVTQKMGGATAQTIARFVYDEPWLDAIEECFLVFRNELAAG